MSKFITMCRATDSHSRKAHLVGIASPDRSRVTREEISQLFRQELGYQRRPGTLAA